VTSVAEFARLFGGDLHVRPHPVSTLLPNKESTMSEPVIPAYRIGDERIMGFRCPCCGGIHTHGFVPDEVIHGRGSHCPKAAPGWTGYRLIVVGVVKSSRMLPKLSMADVSAFNLAISLLRETAEDDGK
jgi:hypothetical protein